MTFMQMDTIAYCHSVPALVGFELKVDAPFGQDQFLKYCFMAAHLEQKQLVAPGSRFALLVISAAPQPSTLEEIARNAARKQLQDRDYPKKNLRPEAVARLLPRVQELVEATPLRATTWDDLGKHFTAVSTTLAPDRETEKKLLDGFLESLRLKRSRRTLKPLFP
jgi:hypothetical protein